MLPNPWPVCNLFKYTTKWCKQLQTFLKMTSTQPTLIQNVLGTIVQTVQISKFYPYAQLFDSTLFHLKNWKQIAMAIFKLRCDYCHHVIVLLTFSSIVCLAFVSAINALLYCFNAMLQIFTIDSSDTFQKWILFEWYLYFQGTEPPRNKSSVGNRIYSSFIEKGKDQELEIDNNNGVITKEESRTRIFGIIIFLASIELIMLASLCLMMHCLLHKENELKILTSYHESGK